MALATNLIFAFRFALSVRQFNKVWHRQILPLTQVVDPDHPLRRRLLWRMKQHTRIIAGFFGPAVFDLFDVEMTGRHRSNLGMIGACIPAFDMCFDENLMDLSRLRLLIDAHATFVPRDGVEKLAGDIYKTLMANIPQPGLLGELANKMLETEDESRLQLRADTPVETIVSITKKKGGTGGLFFTTALPGPLTANETEALYLLGCWVQLVDDLFDLRDDALKGIRTPATEAASAASFALTMSRWRNEAFDAIAHLSLPDEQKIKFLTGFALYDKMAFRYLHQVGRFTGNKPLSSFAGVTGKDATPKGAWKALFD